MSVTRVCPACGYSHTYATDAVADYNHPRHSCERHQARQDAARRRAERARGGPKRDCRHPRAKHVHGTRAAYVKDRCRCVRCTAANAKAGNQMHRGRTLGRWRPYIDASPVREHLQVLRAAGIGVDQIAKLAGLSSSHVRGLIYTTRDGRLPYQRVRADTAEKLLAIRAEDSNRAATAHIEATGTRRRLQALVSIGWTQAWLAAELHRSPANLARSMSSEAVTARTARLVSDLYERLWHTPPAPSTNTQRAASDAARAHAVAQGWLPPLAWDDIDTDPDPDPNQPDTSSDDDLDEIA
ncbi:MAG: helix-turn-helix domain containing protein, partial [Actinobacteria bacterium]|nr:helix-turn-helix domain containing protein [Actinomycetota bacterium]